MQNRIKDARSRWRKQESVIKATTRSRLMQQDLIPEQGKIIPQTDQINFINRTTCPMVLRLSGHNQQNGPLRPAGLSHTNEKWNFTGSSRLATCPFWIARLENRKIGLVSLRSNSRFFPKAAGHRCEIPQQCCRQPAFLLQSLPLRILPRQPVTSRPARQESKHRIQAGGLLIPIYPRRAFGAASEIQRNHDRQNGCSSQLTISSCHQAHRQRPRKEAARPRNFDCRGLTMCLEALKTWRQGKAKKRNPTEEVGIPARLLLPPRITQQCLRRIENQLSTRPARIKTHPA